MHKILLDKIKNKTAKIGIVGLGYVGLPLLIRFSEEDYETIGFDVDTDKINKLNNGKTYIRHIEQRIIKKVFNKGSKATSNFSLIEKVDVIIICVPTPLNANKKPDLSYINSTLQIIKPHLKVGQLMVLESTSYPGTTEEEIVPIAKQEGFNIGVDYYIGYSPEREDPGNTNFSISSIPKIVSGITDSCRSLVIALYDSIVSQIVPVSSTRVAEMTKLLENIHRAVNIGLVNELKMVSDKMEIDIFEVIDAAATKPFGFTPYYPGPGLGGHCIPVDPFYLTWKAKQYGIYTRFIELAGKVNTNMPNWVSNKIFGALKKQGKIPSESEVLIIGVAYKKNVDDVRESPAFKIIELLLNEKVKIDYHDPYIATIKNDNFQMSSIDLSEDLITKYDLVVIVTDHDSLDYDLILKKAKMIIDTRGYYRNIDSVIKA